MVWVSEELLVAEVLAQQAELPQMIGNVFANIGDRAVGADDDLRVLIQIAFNHIRTGARHHPAALVFAFILKVENALQLQLLESSLPEF